MHTILALALIGQMSYSGFFADPPAPKAPVIKLACTNADCGCPPGECRCSPCVCPAKPPVKPEPKAPVQEQTWDLKDTSGRLWRFHDKEKLIEWVAAKNAELSATQAPPRHFQQPQGMPSFGGGSCDGGGCR